MRIICSVVSSSFVCAFSQSISTHWYKFFTCVLIWCFLLMDSVAPCPHGCTCTTIKGKGGKMNRGSISVQGRKVICAENKPVITSIDQINSLPLDTVNLDLSQNAITVLRRNAFNRFSMLRKLNLSNNRIKIVEPGAFQGLGKLEKLDLSNNNIGSVNNTMFQGLSTLSRLYLANNKVNTIPEGAFNSLISLRKIDLKSAYLRCDCHLQWIIKWSEDKNVKIQQSTTCAVPSALKDKPLKSIKQSELHCDRPLELPLFEIHPNHSQIVFEGDKIPFECRASVIDPRTEIVWLRSGAVVQTNRSAGIFVQTDPSHDKTLVTHRLVIENLNRNDKGIWSCLVTTPQGNVSEDVNIVVISNEAMYCQSVITRTSKGVYRWPKTVAGVRSEQICKRGNGMMARHKCSDQGAWQDLNVEECEYVSETTRNLQLLSESLELKAPLNTSFIMKTERELQSLVANLSLLVHSKDLTLAARSIYGLAYYVPYRRELADSILVMISSLMKLPISTFALEQQTDQTCSMLREVVDRIPAQIVASDEAITKFSEKILLEGKMISTTDFTGMTCNAYASVFSCKNVIVNSTGESMLRQNNLLAILQLPKTLFSNNSSFEKEKVLLQLTLFREAKLFPVISSFHQDEELKGKNIEVVSPVLSINLTIPIENLTDPVVLTFRSKRKSPNLVAAYWDSSAHDGLGDWRTDGCGIVKTIDDIIVVHSYHLSIFAILEANESQVVGHGDMKMLLLLPPPMYVGSCICLLCLMAVIITYVSCFRFINVPKKLKHSIINISISVLMLLISFTMGIKRTDHLLACQCVGVAIHYLSLVTMFWITVTSYNMLKKFAKVNRPPSPPPEPVAMPLPPKPMLRFYLLAWGVPMIICGITVAVSIDHYSEPNYCFLAWDPSLGAFYSPMGLLFLFNVAFFLRISHIISTNRNNLNESNHTEEMNDIEMTQNGEDTCTEIQALTSSCPRSQTTAEDAVSIVSSVYDQEKKPSSQFYAVITILLSYLTFFAFGALTVSLPFGNVIPYAEIIFSYLYGVSSSAFGIFMLVYFCLTRKDSCTSWRRFFLCEQHPLYDMSYHNTTAHSTLSNGNVVHAVNHLEVGSKPYNISHDMTDGLIKQTNIGLMNTQGFLTDSSVSGVPDPDTSVFYNPKQNGVAKKFWEKQRHHSKLITREMQKEYNGSDYLSGSEANHKVKDSDVGTHLSIEIQIQPNGVPNNMNSGTTSPIVTLQSPMLPNPLVVPTISTSHGPIPKFSMLPLDRNVIPPVGGSMVGGSMSPNMLATSPCCSVVSYPDSSFVDVSNVRSPSACSLGSRTHSSAFTPVTQRNNTLPKSSKPYPVISTPVASHANNPEFMNRNGSVPRLRDFDGQSQVSESCAREPQYKDCIVQDINNVNVNMNNDHNLIMANGIKHQQYPVNNINLLNSRLSPQTMNCTYKQYGSVDDHVTPERISKSPAQSPVQVTTQNVPYHFQRARSSSGGCSSEASIKLQRKQDQAFLQEVQQRIPSDKSPGMSAVSPTNPKSPSGQKFFGMHDSDSQIHLRRNRGNDSDHNSEPASNISPRRKHRHHDSHHHHHRSKHPKLCAKNKSDWDNFSRQRPKMIPYAYVNHHYTNHVKQKLQKKAKSEGGMYPQLEEGDSQTSSSDDDDLDDVWVMQSKKAKDKKETSV